MKITIEKKFETYTTEFTNVDVSMDQITKALIGMLLSHGWDIEIIKEYIKTDNDLREYELSKNIFNQLK